MRQLVAILLAPVLLATGLTAAAQDSEALNELISSWTLVAVEKNVSSAEPTRARGARGLLILDGAGNVFEFFSTATRNEPEAPQVDPQRTFANFGGFWGTFEVDDSAGQLHFEAASGVSPSVRGLSFSRSFEVSGNRLVITSTDEPQAQGDTRWVWQRVPTVEHLTPAYREVVGFWQHVEEGRVDLATGEMENPRRRAPSVIVYTPGGFVGVHFPSLGREPFSSDSQSAEEAQAGLRGYIGYFGALGVYPGEVSHNILAGISPGTGAILRRAAEITDDTLVVTLQNTGSIENGTQPETATQVILRRLSGADEMLPPEER
jgi:hypothetical protein